MSPTQIQDLYFAPIFSGFGVGVMILFTRSTIGTWTWEARRWASFRYFFVGFTVLFYVMAFPSELLRFMRNPFGFLIVLSSVALLSWWTVKVWHEASLKDQHMREQAAAIGEELRRISPGLRTWRWIALIWGLVNIAAAICASLSSTFK